MTPEETSRKQIDRQLAQCGWLVQDHAGINIFAGPGVAVRESPLKTGFADYMLYADGKAIGIIEAKPEHHTLTGVEIQSAKYTTGLPDGLPYWHLPLPFGYESTGIETQFTNSLDPAPRSRDVFTFHRPDELIRLATLQYIPTGQERLAADARNHRLSQDDVILDMLLDLERQVERGRDRPGRFTTEVSEPTEPKQPAACRRGRPLCCVETVRR